MTRSVRGCEPARVGRPTQTLLRGLRTDAAEVVDDVPHVGGGHLAAYAFHLGIAAGTVGDDSEDLAVRGSVLPLGVRKIGRTRILRREGAVAKGFQPVAVPARLHVRLTALGDR